MDNIQDLIRQATEAAANTTASASTDLAVNNAAPANSVSTEVSYGGGQKSLEELAASATPTVAAYLKVKHEGIFVGDDKTAFDELKVRIRGSEIHSYTAISYGNPAKYGRTLDGRVEAYSNKPWAQFCQMAIAQGSNGPYDSAYLPLYAAEDIVSQRGYNKGKVIVKKGETIGFTTSKSAMREVKDFIRNTIMKLGSNQLLEGTVKLKPLKNESGEWGVLDFGKIDGWKVIDETAEDGE